MRSEETHRAPVRELDVDELAEVSGGIAHIVLAAAALVAIATLESDQGHIYPIVTDEVRNAGVGSA